MNEKIKQLRRDILQISYEAEACHIGSSLSCLEILVDLFYNKLQEDDIFIFSKASGVSALYVILADKGYFPKEKLVYYLKNYPLADKKVSGVVHSIGSLGHGLPVAVGLALADRKRKVYILIGDAELQCGTTWECLLFISQHKIKNLEILVDCNGLQACGKIKDILDLPWSFLKKNNFQLIKTIKGKGVSFCENQVGWHYFNLDKKLLKQALEENEQFA